MIVRLREEESGHEANEIAQRMRDYLSEWLTVPVTYDGHILEAVKVLGDPALVERRWGADVRMAYDLACRGAQAVQLEENPVRVELRRVIRDLRSRNRTFKIYSHHRARPYFTSLFLDPADLPLLDSDFLGSVREYREAGTFDTLVKMGPLRAWGWGSAPDAIVTAPRFQNLVQLVWSGMADDPGFGYDPVSSPVEVQEPSSNSRSVPSGVLGHCIARRPAVVRRLGNSDFDAPDAALDEDEFKLFQQGVENRPGEKRRATLAVVGPQYGILYTPNSQILSFDPMAATTDSKIQLRVLGETLVEGMFVVMPVIGDVNLGADPTNEGKLSRIWKQRLREELQINREALCRILRNKGLNLQHLPGRVENWAEPATTVIHAPQQRKHFQILIDAIAIEAHPVGGVDWWQLAWNEIRHSRGEAIQDGMHEHEIVEEQLIEFLRTMLPRINGEATGKTSFGFPLPTESGLRGNVLFFKVVSIDDGFVVPGTELKMIHELNTIEQWRI